MYCPKCGVQNPDDSNFCTNCGERIKEISPERHQIDAQSLSPNTPTNFTETTTTKINSRNNRVFPKILKVFLIIVFTILACVIGLIILGASLDDEPENKEADRIEKIVSIFEQYGLNEEQSKKVISDLESVGIDEIYNVEKNDSASIADTLSFTFSSSEVSGVLILNKFETYYISSGDIVLFDAEKGGKQDSIDRYILTHDEKISFVISAEDYVKSALKAPSTAKFKSLGTDNWTISRKDDVVTLKSFVDSQNSFGAMIRSNFVVQINYSTSECIYLQIDDTVVYGKAVK